MSSKKASYKKTKRGAGAHTTKKQVTKRKSVKNSGTKVYGGKGSGTRRMDERAARREASAAGREASAVRREAASFEREAAGREGVSAGREASSSNSSNRSNMSDSGNIAANVNFVDKRSRFQRDAQNIRARNNRNLRSSSKRKQADSAFQATQDMRENFSSSRRDPKLDVNTRDDLKGLALVILGIILFVATIIPSNAPVAAAINTGLHLGLGIGCYFVPFAFILWGICLFLKAVEVQTLRFVAGVLIILIAVMGLLSLWQPYVLDTDPMTLFNYSVLVGGGGYAGSSLAWAFMAPMGRIIATIILVGIVLAGLVLAGLSISFAFLFVKKYLSLGVSEKRFSKLRHIDDEQEEDDQEDEEGGEHPAKNASSDDEASADDADSDDSDDDDGDNDNDDDGFSGIDDDDYTSGFDSSGFNDDTSSDNDDKDLDDSIENENSPFKFETGANSAKTVYLSSDDEDVADGYTEAEDLGSFGIGADSAGVNAAGAEGVGASSAGSDDISALDNLAAEQEKQLSKAKIKPSKRSYKKDRQLQTRHFQGKTINLDPSLGADLGAGSAAGASLAAGLGVASANGTLNANGIDNSSDTSNANGAPAPSSADASVVFANTNPAAIDTDTTSAAANTAASTVAASTAAGSNAANTSAATTNTSNTSATEPNPEADQTPSYILPPAKILKVSKKRKDRQAAPKEQKAMADELQQTLEDFGVCAKVLGWTAGPTVSVFKIELPRGTRMSSLVNLADDIALSLAASGVRIAQIPRTSLVGVEIPNRTRETVFLGDVIKEASDSPLSVAIGEDTDGNKICLDLAKMPHLLVAGTTGSGKSVALNGMIMTILMRTTPDQVRLIMVDPKRVEFKPYKGIPHLYVPPVTDPKEAASALKWAVAEMERRLKVLEQVGARNISSYNQMIEDEKLANEEGISPDKIPYIVVIIDELTDLMMVAGKDVEDSIVRISQLARAVGIHLIIATQSPKSSVVTGMIKANITNRLACTVATNVESRVIIDQSGAEKLTGNGDMLFVRPEWGKPKRIQGVYVSEAEIGAVVKHLKEQGDAQYNNDILQTSLSSTKGGSDPSARASASERDPLFWQAAEAVVNAGLGSTSMLQRRLKVGYSRAGRIMDELESLGVVGPSSGSKARDVLIETPEDLEALKVMTEQEEA